MVEISNDACVAWVANPAAKALAHSSIAAGCRNKLPKLRNVNMLVISKNVPTCAKHALDESERDDYPA